MKEILLLKDPDFNDTGFGFLSDWIWLLLIWMFFGFFQVRIQGFSVGFRI